MATEPDIQDLIIEDLKKQSYFSIKDNGVKTRIRTELAEKYHVETVWIKDVVINGYGKEGRRIEDSKIIEILGSSAGNVSIIKTSEDPAEGTATFKDPPATVFFVSSAPGQAGIGLMKIMNAIKAGGNSGLLIVNNGNDGPLPDSEFNDIKVIVDKLGIYSAGVYNGGVSHRPKKLHLLPQKRDDSGAALQLLMPFTVDMTNAGLSFPTTISQRTVAALLSKRFLILTGLAGSGKTKLAQAFAIWLSAADGSYEVVPVGSDWTGNENILGYPNGLDRTNYISKRALDLLIHAMDHPDIPHFLILDEMNLSHVERYFADILSIIESDEGLELYAGDMEKPETWRKTAAAKLIPPKLKQLPDNLFVIGTVNVDETTYMFSPKVLDRANVIEFRMDVAELEGFLGNPIKPDLSKLDGNGTSFGKAFVDAAKSQVTVPADVKAAYDAEMLLLFKTLQPHGAEFGYRTAYETARFIHFYKLLGNYPDGNTAWFPGAFDCVIFQKVLPKLHGSRSKLGPVLKKLWFLCVQNEAGRGADAFTAAKEAAHSTDKNAEPSVVVPSDAPYPLSAEKIGRMWRLLIENGFASFAEA